MVELAPKTGAEYLRRKAKRKRRAARMRALRAKADRRRQCRQCGRPVAMSKRNGKRAKLCRRHLAADWNRKLTYLLALEVRGELWYPLVLEVHLP